MRSNRLLLTALSLTVAVAACKSKNHGGDPDEVELVAAPAPQPVFLSPLEGDVVGGAIAVVVRDGVEEASLGEGEIFDARELLATFAASTDGGVTWTVFDERTLDELEGEDVLWQTEGLGVSLPGREARLRVTLDDGEGGVGDAEIGVEVDALPLVGAVVVDGVDFSGGDPVFTLSVGGYDPDDEITPLDYHWYFQWDGTTVTGSTVMKTVPTVLLEGTAAIVVEVAAEDSDGFHAETTGVLIVPTNGSAVTSTATFCTCKEPIEAGVGLEDINLPETLSVTEPARSDALKAVVPVRIRQEMTVTLPYEGNVKLCRHWQTVRGTVANRGASSSWREKKPTGAEPYHATDPLPQVGRVCGPNDAPCLDGFLYDYDCYIGDGAGGRKPLLVHEQGAIVFNDTPGFPRLPAIAFYDPQRRPTGIAVDLAFVGHCVGTDPANHVTAAYRWSFTMDSAGNFTGPSFE